MEQPHRILSSGRESCPRFVDGLRAAYRTHDFLSSIPAMFGMAFGVSILYSGWTDHFLLWYGPHFVAILGGSYYFGTTRSTADLAEPRMRAGIVYCLISCAIVATPYAVAWGWHRYQASKCILPPGARAVTVSVDPIRWNETPHWKVRCRVGLSAREITDFYIWAISREENSTALNSPTAFWRFGEIDTVMFNIKSDERKLDIAIVHDDYVNAVEIRPPGFDGPPPLFGRRRR